MLSPVASRLSYQQATPAQQAQALLALRQLLRHHFPTLPAHAFARSLAEFRPDLLVHQAQLGFAHQEVTQLVQLLATSPELPLLDPPIYGLPTLDLAQHSLHTSGLTVLALVEFVAQQTRCGPHLYALLLRLVHYYPLAEQVVQAWPWHLASSPPLPRSSPGWAPAPGSPEVTRYLHQLAAASGLLP
jgi:hypothetical protein